LGTWKEHVGNKEKMKKIPPPPLTRNWNEKKKKTMHFECMLSLPIGYMKFLFPKPFVTISNGKGRNLGSNLILINCGDSQSSIFFLLWWASLIGPWKKQKTIFGHT
jgi:hypothetical protein